MEFVIFMLVFLFGLALIVFPYLVAAGVFSGYIVSPRFLNKKIIYRVEGQIKTEKKNTIVVRNATDKGRARWVENPEPLAPDVRFVKVVKDGKAGYKLVPLEGK